MMNYKRAFQIAMVGNILVVGISVMLLSNASGHAATNLGPLRPANGWILRYANKVLTVEPEDGVLVVCSTGKDPVWNSFSRSGSPDDRRVNHTITCPK